VQKTQEVVNQNLEAGSQQFHIRMHYHYNFTNSKAVPSRYLLRLWNPIGNYITHIWTVFRIRGILEMTRIRTSYYRKIPIYLRTAQRFIVEIVLNLPDSAVTILESSVRENYKTKKQTCNYTSLPFLLVCYHARLDKKYKTCLYSRMRISLVINYLKTASSQSPILCSRAR